jgi:putative heme-binding domain-containing protein
MYRETIEHPWSIPDDIKAKLDLSSGNDRGRIYRLRPPRYVRPAAPRLAKATVSELVAHLESPHSWWRETAQRLLFERQDKSASHLLRKLLRESEVPQARLHALWCLAGLQELQVNDLQAGLRDSHPAIRKHAAQLSEPRLRESDGLAAQVAQLADDTSPEVRFQVAFSLGEAPKLVAIPALVEIAKKDARDAWIRAAILSAPPEFASEVARQLIKSLSVAGADDSSELPLLLQQLAMVIGATSDAPGVDQILLAAGEPALRPQAAYALIAGLGQGLARRREKLADRIGKLPESPRMAITKRLGDAAESASNSRNPPNQRLPAFAVLAFAGWQEANEALLGALASAEPREIQQAALRWLAGFPEPEVATNLIARWPSLTPPVREETVNVLLSRATWHDALLGALEQGKLSPSQLSVPQRARLLAIKDAQLAERAKQVLASVALGPRKAIIEQYQTVMKLPTEFSRGQLVYRRECASCHRLAGEGHDVGPSLETVQHRSPQEILIHVLDPNREISPQFLDYAVRLTDGRVLTGMIAAENEAGLTLRRGQRQEDQVLRSEIESLHSSGKSLMPEGLEQKISPQEMADLLAYLKRPRK